jgi:anti-sigma factor RsiW
MSEQDNHTPVQVSEQMMIQYLLGELPEAWQVQFEERLFTDPDSYTQLQVVEENLIDEYVRGKLSADRHVSFESHYLVSERRRRKVAFARTLILTISELPTPARHEITQWRQTPVSWRERTTASRIAFVALALMVLSSSVWIMIEMAQLRKQQDQLKSDLVILKQREQANQIASQPIPTADVPSPSVGAKKRTDKSSKSVNSHSKIVTQTLQPGRNRSEAALPDESENIGMVSISSDVRLIRLRLNLLETVRFSAYRVTLMKAEGQIVTLPGHLRLRSSSNGQYVIVDLPAGLLTRGDYVLTLFGGADGSEADELGDYYFTALRP